MKIIVQGLLIDTNKIYAVSEVVKYNDRNYNFVVHFINKNDFEFDSTDLKATGLIRSVSDIDNDQHDKLTQLHDFVVKHWLENQTEVPSLNFEEKI